MQRRENVSYYADDIEELIGGVMQIRTTTAGMSRDAFASLRF